MALSALACSPDGDDVLVIDGLTLTSTKREWTRAFDHILVAVHYVFIDTFPRTGVEGSPFRSSDSVATHVVAAIDAFGAIHVVEPLAGNVLFALPPLGKPVATAASTTSSELAIALEDRLVVWQSGTQNEYATTTTAVAYGDAGIAWVDGDGLFTRGERFPLPSIGRPVALVQSGKDSWLVGTSAGVFAASGKVKDGVVKRMVRDRGIIVIQPSDTMLAIDLPNWRPWKRVHYTERAITGIELLPGRVLVVALEGGGTNRIELETGTVTKTGAGDWTGEVEDAGEKSKSYVTGKIGNRRGVVAIIPVASAMALCVWTLAHPSHPALPPPRPFVPAPVSTLPPTGCNAGCEADRLDALVAACKEAPDLRCEDGAKDLRDTFGVRQCSVMQMQLDVLRNKITTPGPVVQALAAVVDGRAACAPGKTASYNMLGLREEGKPPLALPAPSQSERPIELVARDALYVVTEGKSPQRCVLYRRAPLLDTQWTTLLTASGCAAGHVVVRSDKEVYFENGAQTSRWDGTTWAPNAQVPVENAPSVATAPDLLVKGRVAVQRSPNDVFVGGDHGLFHFDGATWTTVLKDPVTLLAGNDRDVWVITEAD